MAGDPTRDPHADRGELLPADPHAGEPGDAARFDAERRGDPDQHFLDVAHVAVHIAAIGFEIDDGIADELSRPVIRHVAAASGLEERDAARGERLVRCQHVFAAVSRLRAERDDRRMLKEEQLIRHAAVPAIVHESLLQLERLAVRDEAEAADFERSPDCHRDRRRNEERGTRNDSGPEVTSSSRRSARARASRARGSGPRRRRPPDDGRGRSTGTPPV